MFILFLPTLSSLKLQGLTLDWRQSKNAPQKLLTAHFVSELVKDCDPFMAQCCEMLCSPPSSRFWKCEVYIQGKIFDVGFSSFWSNTGYQSHLPLFCATKPLHKFVKFYLEKEDYAEQEGSISGPDLLNECRWCLVPYLHSWALAPSQNRLWFEALA